MFFHAQSTMTVVSGSIQPQDSYPFSQPLWYSAVHRQRRSYLRRQFQSFHAICNYNINITSTQLTSDPIHLQLQHQHHINTTDIWSSTSAVTTSTSHQHNWHLIQYICSYNINITSTQLTSDPVHLQLQQQHLKIKIQILYSPNFTRKVSRKRSAYKHKQTTTLTYIN